MATKLRQIPGLHTAIRYNMKMGYHRKLVSESIHKSDTLSTEKLKLMVITYKLFFNVTIPYIY
jgi:hypothetical protein